LDTNGTDQDDVDEEILSELFVLLAGADANGLIHACDMFLTNVPSHLANARSALAESRLDDAGHVAHSLRGTAGAFGARRLSRLAGALELRCRQGETASAKRVVEEMHAEYMSFRTVLTSRLASLGAG